MRDADIRSAKPHRLDGGRRDATASWGVFDYRCDEPRRVGLACTGSNRHAEFERQLPMRAAADVVPVGPGVLDQPVRERLAA